MNPVPCARKRYRVGIWFVLLYVTAIVDSAGAGNDNRTVTPPPHPYPDYLADPRSARTGISVMGMLDSDIDDAGDVRFHNSIGKRFGVVRFGDERADDAWQFDIELGYFGQFDIEESLDSIGWDGIYGLYFSRRLSPDLFVRFGDLHDSAHLGDEFIEETGRERIEYTREELIAGLAWLPTPVSTVFAELGWAWDLKGISDGGAGNSAATTMARTTIFIWGCPGTPQPM